jgi:hypothetical protein
LLLLRTVYDAGRAIGAEAEVLGFICARFVQRRDLFLVSRESGMAFVILGFLSSCDARRQAEERSYDLVSSRLTLRVKPSYPLTATTAQVSR